MSIQPTSINNAEHSEILEAINRSINYSKIVEVTDDRPNHNNSVDWISTFCENVMCIHCENGDCDIWGDFDGDGFRIILAKV